MYPAEPDAGFVERPAGSMLDASVDLRFATGSDFQIVAATQ
jgi:hypothetical protein